MTDIADAGGDPLAQLAGRVGHNFADLGVLRLAMAHRSWCAETPGAESNERLEFLGDAVLGWVVADLVYRRHHDLHEGSLTDLRKSVVNAGALAAVAEEIDLGPHILLGRGEAAGGGAAKPSILSDAFEAVLGAVYLDGGPDAAFGMVERLVAPRLEESLDRLDELDHKTQLQETAARLGRGAPVYELTSSGPDHARRYAATVAIDSAVLGRGHGPSKKVAEQAAAADACAAIG